MVILQFCYNNSVSVTVRLLLQYFHWRYSVHAVTVFCAATVPCYSSINATVSLLQYFHCCYSELQYSITATVSRYSPSLLQYFHYSIPLWALLFPTKMDHRFIVSCADIYAEEGDVTYIFYTSIITQQVEKKCVHAYLQQPKVRDRLNSLFLTAILLGLQQGSWIDDAIGYKQFSIAPGSCLLYRLWRVEEG
ncbi:hypothetical protein Q3G72_000196 [Acer saccharum]|nr:hypothetical protein Q3G72_000196 [Acer saccharum]